MKNYIHSRKVWIDGKWIADRREYEAWEQLMLKINLKEDAK